VTAAGLQAARASDYSVAQFRYLQRLLLIHGRWNYRRISKIILYSFYKNIVLYLSQFWFTLNNGFSGQSYYERWTLGQFNVLFTFFPVIFFGIIDQDVSENLVYQYPQLYEMGFKKYHVSSTILLLLIFSV
jgi:phospholipid-transporting ATPase